MVIGKQGVVGVGGVCSEPGQEMFLWVGFAGYAVGGVCVREQGDKTLTTGAVGL